MRRAAAAAVLAGCASGAPAPVEMRNIDPTAPPVQSIWEGEGTPLSVYAMTAEEAFAEGRPTAHIVRPGETLYAIAARHQAPLRALIDLNGLAPPFRLAPGQRLRLPPPATYRVRAGDTLNVIAARHAIHPRSLALLNRRDYDAPLQIGEVLTLPFGARAAPQHASPPTRRPAAAAPGRAPDAGPPPTPIRRASAPQGFGWPVEGVLTSTFGIQAGGRRSDGIDINARAGAPVRAAADGAVVYAGDDLPGYGNLVLIQHAGGIVTAYARLGRTTTRVGARVAKGDLIGEAGETRVHFQMRAQGAAVDPTAALPPRA